MLWFTCEPSETCHSSLLTGLMGFQDGGFTSSTLTSLRCSWHFISGPEFCFDCPLLLWVQNIDDTSLDCSLGNVKGALEKSAEPSGLFRTAGLCIWITSLWIRCITLRKLRIEEDMPVADTTLFRLKYLGLLSCCWIESPGEMCCMCPPLWQEVLGVLGCPIPVQALLEGLNHYPQLQKKYIQFSPKPYSKKIKISWQLEMLFFCQLYTWLQFHLLMETTCKILITGWQLGTEEVMALLNAGRRFHQVFVNCPACSLMWGNDSTVDLWSGPRSLSQTGSLCSMDVIWVSCEQTTWGIMLPRCF